MRYTLALLAIVLPLEIAVAAEPSSAALVGTWSSAEQMPNGAQMASQVRLDPSMKFSGTASVNGTVFWEYSGTWSLVGSTLTWSYEKSSRPLPEAAKVDVDQVVSVKPTLLVLQSKQSGKQHEFQRSP